MLGRNRRAAWAAFVGSFSVYLLPIYTVHITLLWGAVLWMEVFRFAEDRSALWLAIDLGFALLLQAAAGGLVYWAVIGWRWWRAFVLLAAIPVLFLALQLVYQIAIPTFFLIEKDQRGAHGDWPTACTLEGIEIAKVDAGSSFALEETGEAWVVSQAEGFSLLTMPGCTLTKLPIAFSRTVVEQVAPGGGALFYVSAPSGTLTRYAVPPGGQPHVIEAPATVDYWQPVLSSDGEAIAWLERERTADKIGTEWSIRSREIAKSDERSVTIKMDQPASIRLISADTAARRFLARRNEREFVWIDGSGRIVPVRGAPKYPDRPTHGIGLTGEGGVSWDIYREKGRHRVAWSLPAGQGMREVLKGRGINDVSLSPDGRLIAISVGPNTRIGSVKDSVYVLRTADGEEIFRRILPAYTRSNLSFLGNNHLALTAVVSGQARVEVLEVTE